MNGLRALLGVTFLFGFASFGLGQEPAVEVKLDRDQIYLGESVEYQVLLNQFDPTATPEWAETDDYAVRLLSKSVANRTQIIQNGFRTQRIEERGPLLTYEITPRRAGRLTIPGPTAVHDGRTLRGDSVTLRVVEVGEQDYVRLELEASREYVYPTQTFTISLQIFVKPLPEPVADRDPLTVQSRMPTLSLPWADDEFVEAIEPVEPLARWLRPYVDGEGRGFSINNYRQRRDIFSELMGNDFFGGDRWGRRRDDRLGFRPQSTRVVARDGVGTPTNYWKYTIERQFRAEEAGRVTFGPVTMKGEFGKAVVSRRLETEPVFAVANSLQLAVREPPEAGRPDAYVGAIGDFDCGAMLSATTAQVGDPLTLTIWLRGTGSLSDATAPPLDKIPAAADQFKVYDGTAESDQNVRRFTYSLRPKVAGTTTFPAVPIAYFDADREEYVTLRTEPLTLEVARGDALQEDEIAMARSDSPRGPSLENRDEGIFANIRDPSLVRDQRVHPDRWLFGLTGMAGLFALLVVGKERIGRRTANPAAQKRRKAGARARRRLQEARDQESLGSSGVADQLSQALIGLVADAGGLDEQGLTSADAQRLLRSWEIDRDLSDRYARLLDQCDAIRYGSESETRDALLEDAEAVVEELAQVLRKPNSGK